MAIHYYAGARRVPGTTVPNNVTGDCPHLHRTPRTALACIVSLDRAIKRGHGQSAYADRYVMVYDSDTGDRYPWGEHTDVDTDIETYEILKDMAS